MQDPHEASAHGEEHSFGPRLVGQIIHEAYGISYDGERVEPKTLEQFEAEGITAKEVNTALQAGLLLDTMKSLAETYNPGTFTPAHATWYGSEGSEEFTFSSPHDLLNEQGAVEQAKLKMYVQAVVSTRATEVWLGEYREQYPNAFAILYQLHGDAGQPPETVSTLDALDIGLDTILATQQYITDHGGAETMGKSMIASLPAIYKMASQNMEGTGLPIVFGEGFASRDEQLEQAVAVRTQLHDQLSALEPDELHRLKSAMLNDLLEAETTFGADDARVAALEAMDVVLDEPAVLVSYLTGMSPLAADLAADPAIAAHYNRQGLRSGWELPRWLEQAGVDQPEGMAETVSELQRLSQAQTLDKAYFTAERDDETGVVKVRLRPADDQTPARPAEALFRSGTGSYRDERTVPTPADQISPESVTTGCAALYSILPKEEQAGIERACDLVDFHPARMNGIAFTALMTLNATRQAYAATAERTEPAAA